MQMLGPLLSEYLEELVDKIRIQSGQWIRIQEGKIDQQKYTKVKKISCFEVLDVLF
jgi:hypothetical protein